MKKIMEKVKPNEDFIREVGHVPDQQAASTQPYGSGFRIRYVNLSVTKKSH